MLNLEKREKCHLNKIKKRYKKNGLNELWGERSDEIYGIKWMSEELKPFMSLDREVIVLSPSANNANKEFYTYETLKNEGYDCTFIVSDLCGKFHYADKEDTGSFVFIHEDLDAKEINLSDKANIIIDLKGAIWYALQINNKKLRFERFIALLKTYVQNLAEDDSLLFLDTYELNNRLYTTRNIWRYVIRRGKSKIKKKLHEEQSTMYLVKKILGEKNVENLFVESTVDHDKLIHTAHINKRDLKKTINALENNVH